MLVVVEKTMYIPYRKLTLTTTRTSNEVISRLSSSIQEKRISFFRFPDPKPPFVGSINDCGFSIHRAIQYRNSFLPQINGTFKSRNEGTEIALTMTLHPAVIAFMCIWMGGLIFPEAMILICIIFNVGEVNGNPTLIALAPLGMMLFGYLLMTVPFQTEARKVEEMLKEIIN